MRRVERRRRIDLEQRDVGLGVAPDHAGGKRLAVGEGDGDLRRLGDDMVVGHDVAVGIDDEAGPERVGARHRAALFRPLLAAALEVVAEEFLERRARRHLRRAAGLRLLTAGDVDHRRHQPVGKVGEIRRSGVGERETRNDEGENGRGAAARETQWRQETGG